MPLHLAQINLYCKMRKINYILLSILAVVFTFSSCTRDEDNDTTAVSTPAASIDGTYAKAWMDKTAELVKTYSLSPPAASRLFGCMGVAMHEAVVGGIKDGVSLEGQLNDLTSVPDPSATRQYDWAVVLAYTMENMLVETLPNISEASVSELATLRETQIAKRKTETALSSEILSASEFYGKQVAQVVEDWVDTDNYSITRNLTYASPSREGHPEYWDPATLNQTALEPFWGTLRPIFLYNVNACEVPLSIPFGTDETSSMYAEAKVVYDVSVNLTQEQKDIAYYWADNPGQSSTPPGHWIMIMGQMTENLHLNLERTSEMYALGSIALADAFITCWYTKYKYNLLRPVTYIREFMGHPEWTSFIGTPPFPEYTSGHSTGSGAASAILTHLFGEMSFTDRTHLNNPSIGTMRFFNNFEEAAQEAADSRLYGGIHYPNSNAKGLEQGRCIGEQILSSIKLRN